MAAYTNKRGKEVQLSVTRHAYTRFIERYKIAFPDSKMINEEVPNIFEKIFSRCTKVTKLNRRERTRLKRHGDDTMFFRTSGLTFVIQNAQIVTVELSDKGMRGLN